MSVTLRIEAPRWRAAADAVAAALPRLIPVVKGNGYGFGRSLLLAEAGRLGADTVAVGTYAELPSSLQAFAGDVLVMEPYRAAVHGRAWQAEGDLAAAMADPRTVHTVTCDDDQRHLRAAGASRTVIEGLTSMNRFGAGLDHFGSLAAAPGVEAGTLHLPLGTGHVREISRWVSEHDGIGTWFVSHVSATELRELAERFPTKTFRPRVGTALWLGDKASYRTEAHVLDVRPLGRGTHVGYRGRTVSGGHLVVVSGGTSHGVAMESPAAADSLRGRAIVLAEGMLEAGRRVRSPFTVAGTNPQFVEPPHMQCSLLHLRAGLTPPSVGDPVPVRLRLTTAYVDAVVLDEPGT